MQQLIRNIQIMPFLLEDQQREVENEWAQKDVWYWLTHFVYTFDPHGDKKIKRFPKKEHIRIILGELLSKKRLLIIKSRQLLQTWTFCAFFLHDVMYNQGRVVILQAKNQEKSNLSNPLHLCGRVKFIYDHLPESIRTNYPMIAIKKPPSLEFPRTNSYIVGGAQDSEFARQYTLTGYLLDEMAFQKDCMQTLSGILPTLSPDCYFVGLSTANGKNFFYRLIFDLPV